MAAKTALSVRFKKIFELGTDEVNRIDVALIKGQPSMRQIAMDLRAKYPEVFNDTSIHATLKMVQRYKQEAIAGRLHKIATVNNKGVKEITATRFKTYEDRKIDPYYKLEELILLQQERINKLHIKESGTATLMESMRKELLLYSQLLNQLSTLQLDLGIMTRVPRKVRNEVTLGNAGGPEDIAVQQSRKVFEQKALATHKVFSIMEELGLHNADIEDANIIEEVVYREIPPDEEEEVQEVQESSA